MSRSYLFVPADSERKIAKAADTVADALILDLEDSVAPDARPSARKLAADFVASRDDAWVRINPIDSDDAQADLAAVIASAPAGIVLPKPRSAADVVKLASNENPYGPMILLKLACPSQETIRSGSHRMADEQRQSHRARSSSEPRSKIPWDC